MSDNLIRLLHNGEEKKLAISISLAFFYDPMAVYLMPDERKRLRTLNWVLTGMMQYCRKWGAVFTNDDLTAGSAWLLPGHTTMSSLRVLRTNLWQMPFRMGLQGSQRFGEVDKELSRAHNSLVSGDHWYLLMLGTAPQTQGSGAGSAALEVGMSHAAKAGVPVYCETMTEQNVEFYTKRGFEIGSEYVVANQVKTWSLIKQD